jgi:hypothetical protein
VQQTLNNEGAAIEGVMAHDEADFLHQVDAADEADEQNLVGPAETAVDQAAQAHKTYETTVAQLEADDANAAAAANAAAVAAEPDGDFAGGAPMGDAGFQLNIQEPGGFFNVQDKVQKRTPAPFVQPGTYLTNQRYDTAGGYFIIGRDGTMYVYGADGRFLSQYRPAPGNVIFNFAQVDSLLPSGPHLPPLLVSVTIEPQTRPKAKPAGPETPDIKIEGETDPYEGSTQFNCGTMGPSGPGLFLRQRRAGVQGSGSIDPDLRGWGVGGAWDIRF